MNKCLWILLLVFFVRVPALAQELESTTQPEQSSPFSQAKFVPDISLILDVSYLHRSVSDEEYAGLILPGYVKPNEHSLSHEGFNLNYGEITFYSVVDPYFELFAVCHLSEEHFHLEEAYFLTKQLPGGFQIKGGKFLSSFGRINELHTHYWDFADRPLVYRAMFGPEGLNEVGARLTWVAPTETYLVAGGEVLMGANEGSFGRSGFTVPAENSCVAGVNGPGLFVGYLESSVDVGEASFLGRLSGARGETRTTENLFSGVPEEQALSATTTIVGAALTMKQTLDAIRTISFQAEYLWRHMDGTGYPLNTSQQAHQYSVEARQSGFYVQGVVKFALRMRGGARFELLQRNDVIEDGLPQNLPQNLPRFSAMVEYNPTEFSRIRLQYNYDLSRHNQYDGQLDRKKVHELSLQVNLAIGAHGAHAF